MKEQQARRTVVAILEHNGLPYRPDDEELAVRFSSARLRIGFSAIGEQVIITLRAAILRELPDGPRDELLAALNALNCDTHFGKWLLYEDERLVGLEYDLVGDHLQEPELMTALAKLARLADHHDDILQQRFGGAREYESR